MDIEALTECSNINNTDVSIYYNSCLYDVCVADADNELIYSSFQSMKRSCKNKGI